MDKEKQFEDVTALWETVHSSKFYDSYGLNDYVITGVNSDCQINLWKSWLVHGSKRMNLNDFGDPLSSLCHHYQA